MLQNSIFVSQFNKFLNSFSANFTKWSNTLKQFVGNQPTNCLRVFDHFLGLALKRLNQNYLFYSKTDYTLGENLCHQQ